MSNDIHSAWFARHDFCFPFGSPIHGVLHPHPSLYSSLGGSFPPSLPLPPPPLPPSLTGVCDSQRNRGAVQTQRPLTSFFLSPLSPRRETADLCTLALVRVRDSVGAIIDPPFTPAGFLIDVAGGTTEGGRGEEEKEEEERSRRPVAGEEEASQGKRHP